MMRFLKRKKFWYYAGGAVLLVAVGLLAWYYDPREAFQQFTKNTLKPWLKDHPVLGPVTFILVYVVAVVGFMPGSVMTVVAGAVFGPLWGTVWVSIASTTGAALAFLVARYAARDWIERRAGDRLDKLQEGIEKEGGKFVAITRLIPIFPFNLLNYMFGLTRIGFWTYTGLSWLCMIPGTFAYVYAGYAAKVAAKGGKGVKKTMIIIGVAVGVLVLMSMIPKWLKSRHEDTLEEVQDAGDEPDKESEPSSGENVEAETADV